LTVSEVDVSPSTVTAWKLVSIAPDKALCSTAGAMARSVVSTAIIVAIEGAIMPEPLTMPATVTVLPPIAVRRTAYFSRVSVVIMAAKAAASLSRPSEPAAAVMPAWTLAIGRRWPMMPVEATRTLFGVVPSSRAVWAAINVASRYPALPVQTLEQPALMTIARA
jgi:hypothetical protein